MNLVVIDTDEVTPLSIIRYESGASFYLLVRDPKNHIHTLSQSNMRLKFPAMFPYKALRTVNWDILLKHRYEFYLYEFVQSIQQWKELIFF